MSKKYLTGGKRLAIINKWLRGIDDPEYEVYPTKKEGRFIVKPRKDTLHQNELDTQTDTENEEATEQEQELEATKLLSASEPVEPEQDEPIEQPKITPKPKQMPKPKAKQQTNQNASYQFYDPTINIEILNQLKLLGEEIKTEREKKEQKRMIKEAVQKQIAKPRMQYDYLQQPISTGNSLDKIKPNGHTILRNVVPNQDEEMIEQPQRTYCPKELCSEPRLIRKNNIFADMM